MEGNNGERSIKIGEQMSRETETCGSEITLAEILTKMSIKETNGN